MAIVGTAGGTTQTASYDMEGADMSTTAVDLATTIGPVTIAADMFNEVTLATTSSGGGQSNEGSAADDTGVTVSVDVPIGDATVALDNSGNVILSGTWSGVTLSHTVGSGDRASEAIGEIQNFRVPKVPTARRMILNFGDESATCLSRNVVSGGPQLVVELPMTVQLPGGVTVTVLRDNLCCNERLGGKASAWKPRAETEPGMQPSGSKTGNGPTTDGNRATKLFGIS
jgi:hypothetical protein